LVFWNGIYNNLRSGCIHSQHVHFLSDRPGMHSSNVATPPNVCILVSDATGTLEGLRCVLQLLGKLASKSALSKTRKSSDQNRHQSDNHNHEPYRSGKTVHRYLQVLLVSFQVPREESWRL